MVDGHLNKCKECTKADVKENRELNSDYYKAYDRVRSRLDESRKESKVKYMQRPDVRNRATQYKAEYNRTVHRYKREANTALSNAVRDGRVKKLPCFICGKLNVQGHHPSYDLPLDVVWLCIKHHVEIHSKHSLEDGMEIIAKKKANR